MTNDLVNPVICYKETKNADVLRACADTQSDCASNKNAEFAKHRINRIKSDGNSRIHFQKEAENKH